MWCTNLADFICKKTHFFQGGKERQWSGRMGQYSLIHSAIKEYERSRSNWFKNVWGLVFRGEESAEVSDALEKMLIKHIEEFRGRVWKNLHVTRDVNYTSRPSWIANTPDRIKNHEIEELSKRNRFEDCIIGWNMATGMCYLASNSNDAPRNREEERTREAVHMISIYTVHLLLKRPLMMPPGSAKIIAHNTVDDLSSEFEYRAEFYRDSPENVIAKLYQSPSNVLGSSELVQNWEGSTRYGRSPYSNDWERFELCRLLLEYFKGLSEQRQWKCVDGNADLCSGELQPNRARQGSQQGRRAAHALLVALGSLWFLQGLQHSRKFSWILELYLP